MRKPWIPNSKSAISLKISPCIHPFFPKYAPVSTPSSYCIEYRAILTTGPSYYPKSTLCNGTPMMIRLFKQACWESGVHCAIGSLSDGAHLAKEQNIFHHLEEEGWMDGNLFRVIFFFNSKFHICVVPYHTVDLIIFEFTTWGATSKW